MKHTLSISPITNAEHTLNLRNLNNELATVGNPDPLATLPPGARLLTLHLRADTYHIITSVGRTVFLHGTYSSHTYTTLDCELYQADSEIIAASSIGDFVALSTANGMRHLRYIAPSTYVPLYIADAIPSFTLSTAEIMTHNIEIPSYRFVSSYSLWKTPLASKDVNNYSQLASESYLSASRKLHSQGKWVQPVMARYAVRLWDDSLIHASAPMILGCGVQGTARINATVNLASGVDSATLQLSSFRIGLTVLDAPAENWDSLIKAVEIYVASSTDPINTSHPIDYRCDTSGTSGTRTYFLSYTLPHNLNSESGNSLINSQNWHLAAVCTDMAALRAGKFIAQGVEKSADTSGGSLSDRTWAISKAGIYNRSVSSLQFNSICNTRNLSPMILTSLQNHLSGGNLRMRISGGWNFATMSHGNVEKIPCSTLITTRISTFSGISEIVTHSVHPHSSTSLGALITYPDRRATHICIRMLRAGKVWIWESNITAAESGEFAYAVSTDLMPQSFTPTDDDFLPIPAETNIMETAQSSIFHTYPGNPFSVVSRINVGDGCVNAVCEAVKPVSSNIFSKFPLYAFTSQGIFAISASGEYRLIHNLSVDSARMLCHINGAIALAASRNIYKLAGDTLTLVAKNIEASSVAYVALHDELWCTDSNGRVTVADCSDWHTYSRDIFIKTLFSDNYFPIGVNGYGNMLNLSVENDTDQHISYRSKPFAVDNPPINISWNILAQNSSISLTIYGENGRSCHGVLINSINISGAVRSPLWVPLFSPQFRTLRLEIDGMGDHDTRITDIRIVFRK